MAAVTIVAVPRGCGVVAGRAHRHEPATLPTRADANSGDGGSPRRGKSRTFLELTLLADARLAARGASRLAYHFEGAEPPGPPAAPARQYRNPIAVAQEWQRMLSAGECATRADLARKLGRSRARVTQVLGLLELTPEVVEALAALGDPLSRPIVIERGLRSFLNVPASEQKHVLQAIASKAGAG